MSILPTQFQFTHQFNCTSAPSTMSHNLYINLTSNCTWKILHHLGPADFSKKTKPLLCLCQACVHSTSDSADPQESDTEMLTDEQHREIRREKQRGKKRSLCYRLCLWVAGIAITTYGLQAVDSLSSDVHLVGQYSLKWHWQVYCVRN